MPYRRLARPMAALLMGLLTAAPHARAAAEAFGVEQGTQAKPAPTEKPKKPPSAKLAEPWPDAATLAGRRIDAEGRRLFQRSDPLAFTLVADFKAVNRDRSTESTKTFPATLTARDEAGTDAAPPLQVTLRTRGILRLNLLTCSFVPLSIEFPKTGTKGTVFDGQSKLKLVTHCDEGRQYDQYVLLEYLAYRLNNLVTPRSFRVRLARATYVDSKSGRTLFTHNAMFIEDEDDLARRLEGRAMALPRMMFKDFDQDTLTLAMLFQYMIGNPDFSIYALHNVHMVQTHEKVFYPIIWDYDVTGFVNPVYGAPDPKLDISSIRDRVYRGPCRTVEEFDAALAVFRAKQAESMALVDSLPGLDQRNRREAAAFLGQFYALIGRKDLLKRELVDKCNGRTSM